MKNDAHYQDVVVVGGGLAGLAAAAYVARSGLSVTVFERARRFGGRAATERRGDYALNRGPHALYRSGEAARVLEELRVDYTGAPPPTGGLALKGDRIEQLPVGTLSLLTTGLLSWRSKMELGRFLSAIRSLDTRPLDGVSVQDWLSRTFDAPDAVLLIEAFVRLTCFNHRPDAFSAGTAARQLKKSLDGVVYVDDGWQSLVDSLAAVARRLGARTVAGTAVDAIESDVDRGFAVHTFQKVVRCNTVVVAVAPKHAARLLGSSMGLAARRLPAEPVRVSTLDVGLDRLPDPKRTFAVGVDRPLYLSVHSRVARLAPEGGALVHAAKYSPRVPSDPTADRRELEELLDTMQPGWRSVVCEAQFLPSMKVSEGDDAAASGGYEGRPDTTVEEMPGVFLAGDWVKGGSWLADAALGSARRAAAEAIHHARGRRAAA